MLIEHKGNFLHDIGKFHEKLFVKNRGTKVALEAKTAARFTMSSASNHPTQILYISV